FPWVLPGYSQASVLPVAQFASLLGVFGVSALVATVSTAMAYAAVLRPPDATVRLEGTRTAPAIRRFAPLAVVLLVVLSVVLWGTRRIVRGELTRTGDVVRVGLIQGNVDQAEKWDDA